MKKKLLLLIAICNTCTLFSKQVPLSEAIKVATTHQGQNNLTKTTKVSLVKTIQGNSTQRNSQSPANLYYIFNIGNNEGYIIVSADNVCTPIIGYTTNGSYNENNLPPNYKQWMTQVQDGIDDAIKKGEEPSAKIKQEWQAYLTGNTRSLRLGTSVSPLLKTKWGQNTPYWNSIPLKNANGIHPYTGCIATAMAQIMKYHHYPQSGRKATSSYSITNPTYTFPVVDLRKQVYQWNNMADIYGNNGNNSAQDKAVADLMYHCGLAVNMKYSYIESSAFRASPLDALRDYFGYNTSRFYYRDAWSKQWRDMLIQSLNEKLPVFYSGRSENNEGHAFVCDGYDINGLFHFNWGWNGSQDGYYSIDAPLKFTEKHAMINSICRILTKSDINGTVKTQKHNEYLLEFFKKEENINLNTNNFNKGVGIYKLNWYLFDKIQDLANLNEDPSKELILGHEYILNPFDLEQETSINLGINYQSSFIIEQTGQSSYKIKVTCPNNNEDYFYCASLRFVISQKYGEAVCLNFNFLYNNGNINVFPYERTNNKTKNTVSNTSFKQIQDELLKKKQPKANSNINIYDIKGQLIHSNQNVSDQFRIENTNLPNGIYIIEKYDGRNKTTKKVLLKR